MASLSHQVDQVTTVRNYHSTLHHYYSLIQLNCLLCQQLMTTNDNGNTWTLPCRHKFHAACLRTQMCGNFSCPCQVCGAEIYDFALTPGQIDDLVVPSCEETIYARYTVEDVEAIPRLDAFGVTSPISTSNFIPQHNGQQSTTPPETSLTNMHQSAPNIVLRFREHGPEHWPDLTRLYRGIDPNSLLYTHLSSLIDCGIADQSITTTIQQRNAQAGQPSTMSAIIIEPFRNFVPPSTLPTSLRDATFATAQYRLPRSETLEPSSKSSYQRPYSRNTTSAATSTTSNSPQSSFDTPIILHANNALYTPEEEQKEYKYGFNG